MTWRVTRRSQSISGQSMVTMPTSSSRQLDPTSCTISTMLQPLPHSGLSEGATFIAAMAKQGPRYSPCHWCWKTRGRSLRYSRSQRWVELDSRLENKSCSSPKIYFLSTFCTLIHIIYSVCFCGSKNSKLPLSSALLDVWVSFTKNGS